MLLQSYRVVNQQNVLLFPDFPFFNVGLNNITGPPQGKRKYMEKIHGERQVQPDSYILPLRLTNGPWANVSTWIALLKTNVLSDNPGLRQIDTTANYF